jgi:hypothetical protein
MVVHKGRSLRGQALTCPQLRPTIPASGIFVATRGADSLPLPHSSEDRWRGHGCGL